MNYELLIMNFLGNGKPFGFPTQFTIPSLFSDTFASPEQVWTLPCTLSKFTFTNSDTGACWGGRTQYENRYCCCQHRGYYCCDTQNGNSLDYCRKNHHFLMPIPSFHYLINCSFLSLLFTFIYTTG